MLLALGILGILWGVFHVLGHAYGADGPARVFAQRESYNEVKTNVHGVFLGGLLRSLAGLVVAWTGARLRRGRAPDPPAPA